MIKKIILITIDCLRADHIHYNGYKRNITPTIDMLAREGSNFFNSFSNGPHTHYSFPSILTSTYSLMFTGPKLGYGRYTLAEYLKRIGFKTIGLNSNPFLSEYFGYSRGFDIFNDFLNLDKKKKTANLAVKLKKHLTTESRFYKLIQFLDRYISIKGIINTFVNATELTKMIIGYLEEFKEENLFIWAHFMDAHYPYVPDKSIIKELGFEDFNDIQKAFLFTKMLNHPKNVTEEEIKVLINLYDAQIYNIDTQLNKIYLYLKEISLLEETLIIITADHGEEFREYGEFSHRVDKNRAALNNVHLHIPLVFYFKGKQFYDVKNYVSLIDLSPTIVDILGNQPFSKFLGKSFLPLMEKRGSQKDRHFFTEHEYQREEIVGNLTKKRKKAIAYISPPYKLIYYEGKNKYWFFNFETDPSEKNNLINSLKYKKIIFSFKKKIENHLRKIEESKIKLKLKKLSESVNI